MAATGELIRLINYVDERKRLADTLRGAETKLRELLQQVEK